MPNPDIKAERYRSECAENRAKFNLIDYVETTFGAPLNGDRKRELESIVEDIITAATARATARVLEEIKP